MSDEIAGNTTTTGQINCVSAAATADLPGNLDRDDDSNDSGVTDTNGNLICKAYA